MTLKFTDKNQFTSGKSDPNWRSRFPAGMQSLDTCPAHATVIAVERNGQQHYAINRPGVMKKLAPFKDWKTGQTFWREDGTQITDAVGWLPPKRG